jgi:transmembrane sensor
MNRRHRSKFNVQIYQEACEWLVECRAGDLDAAARGTLDQWLRRSPEHVSAYLEVAAIWNEGSSLDPERKWDLATLIDQAARDPDNVGIWNSPTPDDAPLQYLTRPPRWRVRAIAASVAAIAIVAATIWMAALSPVSYATAIGEQRFIQLGDSSTVELNSYSTIAVHFSRRERDVKLLRGQALFHVAKDATRPFVVASGNTTVRALGTRFDVYLKDGGTIVTVVEGRVAIVTDKPDSDLQPPATTVSATNPTVPPALPSAAPPQATGILLSAGEQLTVTLHSVRKTEHANVVGATAWTEHQIVFDGASLSDVAEEFNRYNRKHLVIDGPSRDTFHISGVFSSTDSESLIRFLRDRPGLRIVETATEIRIQEITS